MWEWGREKQYYHKMIILRGRQKKAMVTKLHLFHHPKNSNLFAKRVEATAIGSFAYPCKNDIRDSESRSLSSLVNVISRLVWSHLIIPIYYFIITRNHRLMLSFLMWLKVITLGGFHCSKFKEINCSWVPWNTLRVVQFFWIFCVFY
jgi:hypothetical protein